MLILHLSDIHFREPECTTPELDENRHVRTRLMQDARRRCKALGGLDAILVGGDIAFKGHPDEYEAAHGWLVELADQCSCPLERVYVIPGNHDIDRGAIARSQATQNTHRAIRQATDHARKNVLLAQLRDDDAGRALFTPLTAYNAFAARFNCQVSPPNKIYWRQELPLDGGLRLRINGLTSTLLSGEAGRIEDRDLYLSPLQTAFDPEDDVVHLVLCHHPPDWFIDGDDVDDAIRGRAAIHLFGHEHRQRVQQDASYIRFSAGAVNPDRTEGNWQPGYNLIGLEVQGEDEARTLCVEAHVLEWQANPDGYRAKLANDDAPTWRHRIRAPAWMPATTIVPTSAPQSSSASAPSNASSSGAAMSANTASEIAMGQPSNRNLIYRFWRLAVSQRRELVDLFNLLEPGEDRLPEPERYGRALLRARDKGLLDDIGREIERLET